MHVLTIALATYAVYLIPLSAALLWWRVPRHDKLGLAAVGVLTIALALAGIGLAGYLWTDPRPFVVDGTTPLIPHAANNGFPSDHTTLAAAIAAALYPWRRRLATSLLLLALVVGAARVAAHVHHIPDIIGGLLIGIAAAALAVTTVRLATRSRPKAGDVVGLQPDGLGNPGPSGRSRGR